MSRDPLVDVRDQEDCRESYLNGWRWKDLPSAKDDSPPLKTVAPINPQSCWCGRHFSHDWPGRDEGAPHPKDW